MAVTTEREKEQTGPGFNEIRPSDVIYNQNENGPKLCVRINGFLLPSTTKYITHNNNKQIAKPAADTTTPTPELGYGISEFSLQQVTVMRSGDTFSRISRAVVIFNRWFVIYLILWVWFLGDLFMGQAFALFCRAQRWVGAEFVIMTAITSPINLNFFSQGREVFQLFFIKWYLKYWNVQFWYNFGRFQSIDTYYFSYYFSIYLSFQ